MAALGVLLFGHGSRDAAWAAPFEAVAAKLRAEAPSARVALAYLEFMSPTIAEAGAMLAADGCVEVVVVPLFLGVGGHVRKDLPALIDSLAQRHPAVRWRLAGAIGEHPLVIDAMAAAVRAAL
ncbi:sirohydrochlorin chelatase [Caldimonas sp. KR1-144]|uniref:sirohydrochlorin chelatase n=1 Tax=Caldimonas sp. KR1-144 TaxID=3400911 RepID=UPI003C08A648